MVAGGKVHHAQSVATLAAGFALPGGNLEVTVERYNAAVAAGEDFDYLKDPKFLQPIASPPFYAAEIRPATVVHCRGHHEQRAQSSRGPGRRGAAGRPAHDRWRGRNADGSGHCRAGGRGDHLESLLDPHA
jgi:hypothetical protein